MVNKLLAIKMLKKRFPKSRGTEPTYCTIYGLMIEYGAALLKTEGIVKLVNKHKRRYFALGLLIGITLTLILT